MSQSADHVAVGLAVVNRHIATAAPFTMGALHGSAGKRHLRNALPEAATNAPQCLIDAESAQRPQRHDLNTMDDPKSLSLALPDGSKVSALLRVPEDARALYVFAHGAGAGMQHAGMSSLADALAAANVATLRYQFPYMERGSKRVDSPAVAHAAVQAAVAEARRRLPALPLFAGGRSFGGRMTSQAQAISPLDGVRGLAFVAFPLHPAGKPSISRRGTSGGRSTRTAT